MNDITTSVHGFLQTGQRTCYDPHGREIPCQGTGQDAVFSSGHAWPKTRFEVSGNIVLDRLTDLMWLQNANIAEFPFSWREALAFVTEMNATSEFGFSDWRLPNRRELRSLISYQTRRPSLPEDHPFTNIFAHWYWSSTTAAAHPDHAWYVNLDGGRMFYGGKDQAYMVWPVRSSGNATLPRTGQIRCYDESGQVVACSKTGQDGEYRYGLPWPEPRFECRQHGILDQLTGLLWGCNADLAACPVSWAEALAEITRLNTDGTSANWRLPNINELESLVDCAQYKPALPAHHPFNNVQDIYWSSTTSLYEPDWAWALYLDKGATGVGQKSFARFHVWPVMDLL
jgi:hypothetical protein